MNHHLTVHQNINYLVVGLGLTGYSVALYLLRNGYTCKVIDSRSVVPYEAKLVEQFPSVEIIKGDFQQTLNSTLIDWAEALVVSPGLSIRQNVIQIAAEQGKRIIGDIELFAEAVEKPVVAITGSNGKSTVTTLVGEMIESDGKTAAVGGNLGVPALDLLNRIADFYVLELSSYQLETTSSLRPVVSTILNLSEDHLDRYDSFEDYAAAKRRIHINSAKVIANYDDEYTRGEDDGLGFSLNPASKAGFKLLDAGGTYLCVANEAWVNVNELAVTGRHNWSNCLAAMALASVIGISRKSIVRSLKLFAGIPHRSQLVRRLNGVVYVNDSKATNVGAALASIEGRSEPVILIAGGQSKSADMTALNDALKKRVKLVLLIGEDADILYTAWHRIVTVERASNMNEAVDRAHQVAEKGDCVLLAPACASFDMYEKFEARGDDFSHNVMLLEDRHVE